MFQKARPIKVDALVGVMNGTATFEARVESLAGAELHLCAADLYRVTVNGQFVANGPARTAKGYARMDRIKLDRFDQAGGNRILITVVGYGCRSFSTVRQPAFLWAEILRGDEVLVATGYDFSAYLTEAKHAKTARYSKQRHFVEEWDLRLPLCTVPASVSILNDPPQVLERRAPYPCYRDRSVAAAASVGSFVPDPTAEVHRDFYSFVSTPDFWGFYDNSEVERHSYEWVQEQKQVKTAGETALPLALSAGQYAIFDATCIECGFLRLWGSADGETDIVLAFSEDASPDRFAFTDMHAHTVIDLTADGDFDFLSIEPYVFKYAAVFVKRGGLHVDGFGVKTYEGDVTNVRIPDAVTDPCLRGIYAGAVRSYAHNAVDLYTDCPSRERAGWLCDSYFTAKTEYCLTGKTAVEDAFLENFRLYRNEGELPSGALPECYPTDIRETGQFIPQWTMWYILEVADYVTERGHWDTREDFRRSVYDLLAFYERYENSDGLLEALPSWNFVEWSRANDWTQDVSYPTNFLYAEALRCVERLFGDKQAGEKAERVAREAVRQSFDGEKFLDHAVRKDGKLVRCNDCSEACQYYAILFAGIDPHAPKYRALYRMVMEVFGADRTVLLEEIAPINAFIGAYLRLEALLKLGENTAVLNSLTTFFGGMAEETATLWEYRERHGSRDHGFASYALVAMRKALGID